MLITDFHVIPHISRANPCGAFTGKSFNYHITMRRTSLVCFRVTYRAGAPASLTRTYYYYLNERGDLYHMYDPSPYVIDGKIPSGPAFLSEPKFSDFFFSHLWVTPPELYINKFPYISRCGTEGNYLAVEDAPIVFTSLAIGEDLNDSTLGFAGTLQNPFDPQALRVSGGRLYHPITYSKFVGRGLNYGLVGSSVGVQIGFDFMSGSECQRTRSEGPLVAADEEWQYVIDWGGKRYPVPEL
jgi:hypothetical protein